LMFRQLEVDTSYWYVLLSVVPLVSGIALAMSPMTAAIMSAVPARRAGAGSAMNDATREMGAALGVAVLGSMAASRYASSIDTLTTTLPASAQEEARQSLAGALHVASGLPEAAGQVLSHGADVAFVDGVHFAVTVGAVLAAGAAVLVLRFLPRVIAPEGGLHDPIEAMEEAAELGIAGFPPLLEDEVDAAEAARAEAVAAVGQPIPDEVPDDLVAQTDADQHA